MVVRKHDNAPVAECSGLFAAKGLKAFFTDREIDQYFNGKSCQRLAARYLAKKIILEHIGINNGFTEISIMNDTFGRPAVEFGPVAAQSMQEKQIATIHLSLSHSRKMASAYVVFEYLYA